MGVGVEYFDKRYLSNNAFFVKPGSCRNESLKGQKTRMVIISSIEQDIGTVLVAGDTHNVDFHIFESELDNTGHPAKANLIDDSGKTGVFIDIKFDQELLITSKKRKNAKPIVVFMCDSPTAMAEKLLE